MLYLQPPPAVGGNAAKLQAPKPRSTYTPTGAPSSRQCTRCRKRHQLQPIQATKWSREFPAAWSAEFRAECLAEMLGGVAQHARPGENARADAG